MPIIWQNNPIGNSVIFCPHAPKCSCMVRVCQEGIFWKSPQMDTWARATDGRDCGGLYGPHEALRTMDRASGVLLPWPVLICTIITKDRRVIRSASEHQFGR